MSKSFSPLPLQSKKNSPPTNGFLQKTPVFCTEIFGARCSAHYEHAPIGLSLCPFGFSTFKFRSDGDEIVWTSLKVDGFYKPKLLNKIAGVKRNRRYFKRDLLILKSEFDAASKIAQEQIEESVSQCIGVERNSLIRAQTLTTMVFHEMRPLTALAKASAVQGLQKLGEVKHELSGRYELLRKDLEAVQQAANLLSKRMDIRDFLINPEFYKDVSSKISVRREIEKIIPLIRRSIPKDKVQFRSDIDNRLRVIYPKDFTLLLFVLIENAVKYSPDEQDVRFHTFEQNRNLTISIDSYGPLIARDERQTIFDEFVRGREAKRTAAAGNGIGLYFARLVAEMCGCRLRVDQENDAKFGVNGIDYYRTRFEVIVEPNHFDYRTS